MTTVPVWTVYHSPSDFPGLYVVRRSEIRPGGVIVNDKKVAAVAPTLAEARFAAGVVARGLTCFPRLPEDLPAIVECWL